MRDMPEAGIEGKEAPRGIETESPRIGKEWRLKPAHSLKPANSMHNTPAAALMTIKLKKSAT